MFSGEALHLIAPAAEGEMGIYPGHTPLLATLLPGTVHIHNAGGVEDVFYVASGLLEIQPYVVTVLADTAVRGADVDEANAQAARDKSERLLAGKAQDFDYARAASELAQAVAQLRTVSKMRRLKKR